MNVFMQDLIPTASARKMTQSLMPSWKTTPSSAPLPASETLTRKGIVLPGNNESYLRLYTHRHHTDCFFAALLQRRPAPRE